MPHRAGYFVLAYTWDHHCRRLYDILEGRLRRVERAVAELERDGAGEPESLYDYYGRWQGALELCRLTVNDIRKRQYVINSLGYRGYGVNRDLLAALGALGEKSGRLEGRLEAQFRRKATAARASICLPEEMVKGHRADYIMAELRKRLGRDDDKDGHEAADGPSQDLSRYWQVMVGETSWEVNTAIFQRMFFSGGCASMTIMKGSTGLHNGYSSQELKLRANTNFVRTVREVFAGLSDYTEIRMGMLRRLHHSLTKGLDPDAGSFRQIDFPDRNGVTFEFDNFQREVSDLAIVLSETARSFHRLDEFIYNLARSYYMFIGIHPFWDCNGRVGRCFLNFLFLKKGLPPVTLNDDEEVLALPRYGGSMEDMHDYLWRRLHRATNTYLYERWKLETFGLLGKRIHNASFDSGFHFRQIDDRPPKIEVHFEAFVIDDSNDLSRAFMEESRVVLPESSLLFTMIIYCGFCDAPFAEWRYPFRLKGGFYTRELASDIAGVRVFDVDLLVDIPRQARPGDTFACSIVSEERGLIFNNKGLNYSYRLEP
jgi:hypothetical protein